MEMAALKVKQPVKQKHFKIDS